MTHSTDFLVIGTGISGLSFALKAADLGKVTIVTKKLKVDTATNRAQGGIAAVLSKEDSYDLHIRDTLRSGVGLCNEEVVRLVVENGPARIQELLERGVRFNVKEQNPRQFDLGMEGGHSARRIAHALDLTGREIENALLHEVSRHPEITVLENHMAVDLLLLSKTPDKPAKTPAAGSRNFTDRCLGSYILDRQTGRVETWLARETVLCTGGSGKVYLYTTNPDIATGDGVAMAFRAGARVANLEFVQFHPTCLYHPKAKNFLISEAVRGEGARLIDERGQTFMQKYDERGELATRDTVARAIDTEMKASGDDCVYLDISHRSAEFIKSRFPHIYATCLSYGVDMTKEPIPVVPAAHYMCGGVMADVWGRTSLENLYALGETACTGLHGGNRLASNSLLEAVVFAHQAFLRCRDDWPQLARLKFLPVPDWSTGRAENIKEGVLISHTWDQIRRLMWNYVGIVRTEKRLALVQSRLSPILREVAQHYQDYLLTPDLIELRNIALMAELIIHSAILRKETRGLHCLLDHPHTDDTNWRKDTVLCRQDMKNESF